MVHQGEIKTEAKNNMKKKLFFPAFILFFTILLSSCSNPVSYSVDKEHEEKMEVIYNMISGLVENDSKLYLSTIEPEYIANVKKVVDTLGRQYFDAENFDDLIKSFFYQYEQGLEANYGKNVNVALSFNSVKETSKDSLSSLFDDYSVSYEFPLDNIKAVFNVSVKMNIKGASHSESKDCAFTLFEMQNGDFFLHPESFLYSF